VFCYDIYFADTLDGKFLKGCGRKYFISTLKVLNFRRLNFVSLIFDALHSWVGPKRNQVAAA
jgi:hypothetical protein